MRNCSLFNFASQSKDFKSYILHLLTHLIHAVFFFLFCYSTLQAIFLSQNLFFTDSLCSVITKPDSAIYIEPWPVPQFIGYTSDIITFVSPLVMFLNPFYTQMNSTIFCEILLDELVYGQVLSLVFHHPPMNIVASTNVHYLCTGAGMGGPYNIDPLYVRNLVYVVVTPTFLQQACTYVFHFQA